MNPGHSFFENPHPSHRKGILSWLHTYDHKRIGLLYLFTVFGWFLIAMVLGLLMRTVLMKIGSPLMDAGTYNRLFTVHGVIMVFLFAIPAIPAVFGNFFLPLQIGASDVFFPRINLFSYYLYLLGGLFALFSVLAGAADTGWTFYVPFSTLSETHVGLTTTAAFILGFSSILTGLNFITTVHRLRAKAMHWGQIPLFTWAIYATAWVQVLATPIIGITLLLIILERLLGIGLFDPAKGGDPLLYQHLFWMYSHPAVYIMILPAMGVISEVVPVFARKPIFGYKAIVASGFGIAGAGSLVWAHHMFASGISDVAVYVFSLLTFLVAVPSAVKVFNWTATLYRGSIRMSPALFFALCFIFLFSLGGLMGLVQASAGTNIHIHDTHFVVSHFHFVMFGGTGFGFLAACYYWWPKMFGRLVSAKPAYVGGTLLFIGFLGHYIPMGILGILGMPRRYYDYLPELRGLNFWAGIGAYLMVAGLVVLVFNLFRSLRAGAVAPQDPWGGTTLEWTIPSPPPVENFETEPVIKPQTYDFSALIQKENSEKDRHGKAD